MLASRLVKSCLFMLVALAPMAAKASFVIDDFSGPSGNPTVMAGTNAGAVTATRSVLGAGLTLGGGLGVYSEPGTSGGAERGRIEYSFSSPLSNTGFVTNSERIVLNFASAAGPFDVEYRLNGTDPFVMVGTFSGSNSAFKLAFDVPSLLDTSFLSLRFTNLSNTSSSFVIDSVTATPEPASMLLFGTVLGAGFYARRRFKGCVAK